MMLRPEERISVTAACQAGSTTGTTPPKRAPVPDHEKPRSPMRASRSRSFWRFSASVASANSTTSSASGSPRTTRSTVGRNMAMSRASPIIVRSTSSTAMGFSVTRCWAASIASWNEPKWQMPKTFGPSSGQSFRSTAVVKASVPSEPTRICAMLLAAPFGTRASRL